LKALAAGTLVASHNRLFVKVASNGGTVDANAKAVTIGEPILEDSSSTGGGMTFKGGGKVTLAGEEKDRAVALMRRVEAGVQISMSYCINRAVSIS
jgi:hypothetical protein